MDDSSPRRLPAPTRAQRLLVLGALVSYAVGYPVALWLHSGFGWVLVMLGGVFLLALGVVTIRRLTASSR